METVTRINKLKAENEELEQKVQTLTKQLGFLKELFISHSANTPNGKFEGIDLEKLLNDPDDDIPPPRKGR